MYINVFKSLVDGLSRAMGCNSDSPWIFRQKKKEGGEKKSSVDDALKAVGCNSDSFWMIIEKEKYVYINVYMYINVCKSSADGPSRAMGLW